MSFRLVYNKILTSTTVIIECISWLINVTDTVLRATDSACSVVPKATVAPARGATMQIVVRGLFCVIYEQRIEDDKKREIRFYADININFIFNLRGKMGRICIRILREFWLPASVV